LPPLQLPARARSAFKRIVVNNLTDFFKDSIKFLKGCRTPGDQRAWRGARRGSSLLLPRCCALTLTPPPAHPVPIPSPRARAAFAIVLGLTGTGAVVMGLISFVVKVVHIPLTQVLVLKSD
jgi:preprotein translocase subunit Sss1